MLNSKVVVVTGGAGLLGKEFIRAVIENAGTAIIADFNDNKGQQITIEMKEQLPEANIEYCKLDINNNESILTLINHLDKNYGRIDALVNNAYPRNKNYGRKFEDVEYDDFNENINLNLGGYFLTSQIFSSYFVKQGFGNIINIASIYGVVAPRFDIYNNTTLTMPVEYAVIKSGLLHLTKYMARYFKGKNIRVNSISLGGIEDGQPKSFLEEYRKYCLNKGMLNAEDICGSLVFLLSDKSKFINGQNIVVDDGFTL